jgi:hypothetical protein
MPKSSNKPAADTDAVVGYCVKCKTKRPIKGGAPSKTKSGSNMHLGGKCNECGTGMAKILPADKKKIK